MVCITKKRKFQDDITEEYLYDNVVEEVVNALIIKRINDDPEEAIIKAWMITSFT